MNLTEILRHAGVLQRATTLRELVDLTWDAVRTQTRYRTAWLALVEPEDPGFFRIVQVEGSMQELVLERCPKVAIAGDAMLLELVEGRAPVLVLEAALDARTNKAMVAALGNRTILNIPLVLGPTVVGALGVGSFGEEGVLAPNESELEALVVLGTQLAGAIARMQLLDRERQNEANSRQLERQLESLQRVELMGVLAAGVAHDLNNCLTIVLGNLATLGAGTSASDGDAIDDAMHAASKATDIVRQLLSLGRAHPRVHESVDLNARVTSTLQLVRSSIPADVGVRHVAGHAPALNGDPVQIDQAIANLLINARDAVGPAGEIVVDVGERELSEDFVRVNAWARTGRFGHVRVRDTGAGIAADILPHIFDPLFSTKALGTGLGLAVVSRVVQQHDGLLHCESSLGAGTTFDLYLPADVRA